MLPLDRTYSASRNAEAIVGQMVYFAMSIVAVTVVLTETSVQYARARGFSFCFYSTSKWRFADLIGRPSCLTNEFCQLTSYLRMNFHYAVGIFCILIDLNVLLHHSERNLVLT